MDKFVVSARKYRPSKFTEVVGQQSVTQTLKNAIKTDHLGHSFLFCGPRGVGKTTCARILAKTINCEAITPEFEACGECPSCKAFQESSSFNVFELDAASNSHVDDIRGLIEQVRYAPQTGNYKIYIIDEVHMLSQSAFNAFLKTLEEPPSYAIFILATTEKHKIIPTILSRCQIFDFNRIRIGDMVDFLNAICSREQLSAEEDALHMIAQKSDGALRDALSIFDRIVSFSEGKISYQHVIDNLNILDYDYFFNVIDALLVEDVSAVLNIFNEVLQKGFEGDNFIYGLGQHCRDLLVCKDEETLCLLEVSDQLREKYKAQAATVPVAFLLNALDIINTCDTSYKASKHKRLHVEMALIKLSYIQSAVALATGAPVELPKKKPQPPEAKPAAGLTADPSASKVPEADVEPAASEQPSVSTTPADVSPVEKTESSTGQVSETPAEPPVQSGPQTPETAPIEPEPVAAEEPASEYTASPPPPSQSDEQPAPVTEPATLEPSVGSTAAQQVPETPIKEKVPEPVAAEKPASEQSEDPAPSAPPQSTPVSPSEPLFADSVRIKPLDEITQDVKNPNVSNESEQETEAQEDKVIDDIVVDPEALQEHWKAYAEQLAKDGRMSLHALMSVIPPVTDKNQIIVKVENQLQLEIFEQEKINLLAFLKTKLDQPSLVMILKIEKDPNAPVDKTPYTAKEKFEKMAEKEPLIKEFQNRLNLELDF